MFAKDSCTFSNVIFYLINDLVEFLHLFFMIFAVHYLHIFFSCHYPQNRSINHSEDTIFFQICFYFGFLVLFYWRLLTCLFWVCGCAFHAEIGLRDHSSRTFHSNDTRYPTDPFRILTDLSCLSGPSVRPARHHTVRTRNRILIPHRLSCNRHRQRSRMIRRLRHFCFCVSFFAEF